MSAQEDIPVNRAGLPLSDIIKNTQQAIPPKLTSKQRAPIESFLPTYFGASQAKDLEWISPDDLCGLAISHWQLAQVRQPDAINLRIYNPQLESDGWQTPNTVLELVTNDQPHLITTVRSTLIAHGHNIRFILHPQLLVVRDNAASCTSISRDSIAPTDAASTNANTESFIHIQFEYNDDEHFHALEADLRHALSMLSLIKADAEDMQSELQSLSEACSDEEQAAFYDWLQNNHFNCLGMATISVDKSAETLPQSEGFNVQPLGLLRDNSEEQSWAPQRLISLEAIQQLRTAHNDIVICKAETRSPVINNEFADIILIPQRGSNNEPTNIRCIVGLFTAALHSESIESIPLFRQQVNDVITHSNYAADSHDSRALSNALRSFPREMLLQMSAPALLATAQQIVSLHERQQIRLFHSTDPLGRFCHCLVYVPRDTYGRELRLEIERILMSFIKGKNAQFRTEFSSESALARIHFVIQKQTPLNRDIDWQSIETRIQQAAITWDNRLLESLRAKLPEPTALNLYRKYNKAFSSGYKEDYSARIAVSDIQFIEEHVQTDAPVMSFYRHILADTDTINFKLFCPDKPVPLSDVIPIIENMGLRVEAEHPFEVKRKDMPPVWIHEFTVEQLGESKLDSKQSAENIQKAFTRIWNGDVENDGFNRLILAAGLDWQEVVVLRSYSKYLLQIGVPFSQTYMIDSLVANSDTASKLIALFKQRFDPHQKQGSSLPDTKLKEQEIINDLEQVASLDEDRILRSFFNLIMATLRTNFYCVNDSGESKHYLSFKLDSAAILDLPLPRPMAEIYVYSPRFEGIHLRGGRVARGGLRWSDRREDFRTEVLGLMKAQMVKNAVIVPVGSKGGFYVKQELSDDRESMMQQVVACYQNFLRGLLDLTDNIVAEKIVAPNNVLRYDNDDPYLVVAADKGTATFSDFANDISAEYHFWLGDAFASGGSVGYDHKKMGITARGAWESVKRHFRELGHDTQTQDFTVVGIGDMAGDVFGNGMLLSEHIQLVAAFNHQHIMIDPTPDAASSYKERARLFELPRSSWEDYNTELLSKGGAIVSRSDKSIVLSAEAQSALAIDKQTLTPNELINLILRAPVDLLWNGGIGTYIKASGENHADAADKANDAVRVDASQLRCKVIGEGGNLGCTQRGRIEYARDGGMIYTDAIDNSAGVDCSDHEVNIKILLNAVVANDDMTLKQRDKLLADMTTDVGHLVLTDNYLQTQCINQCFGNNGTSLDEAQRFMQHLESIDRLDRRIEFLPDNEEIADRQAAEQGLSRPEIAVLVSYSKMVMYDDLLASDLAQETALQDVLMEYFPKTLTKQFAYNISNHRLSAEIISTVVTNELVNRLGPTFAFRMQQELGAQAHEVAQAFVAVRNIFQLPLLWHAIESLDNKTSADVQNQMHILVRGLVERSTHWLLRSRRGSQTIDQLIAQFKPAISELIKSFPGCLAATNKSTLDQRIEYFVNNEVPIDTATAVSQVVPLSSSLDIVEIALSANLPVELVAGVYFELGAHLELHWLREQISDLQVISHWHTLSKSELRSDLHYQQRHLSAEVITSAAMADAAPDADNEKSAQAPSAQALVSNWSSANAVAVNKYQDLITDMKASGGVDFAMLSLAVNEVHKLLRSDRPLAAGQ